MHLGCTSFTSKLKHPSDMGLDAREPFFRVCKQQRRRSACASTQSGQPLCYLLMLKYHIYKLATSEILGDWFESRFVGNPEDRFCRDEAHIIPNGPFDLLRPILPMALVIISMVIGLLRILTGVSSDRAPGFHGT